MKMSALELEYLAEDHGVRASIEPDGCVYIRQTLEGGAAYASLCRSIDDAATFIRNHCKQPKESIQ